jgi:hypothetical protein
LTPTFIPDEIYALLQTFLIGDHRPENLTEYRLTRIANGHCRTFTWTGASSISRWCWTKAKTSPEAMAARRLPL